MKKKKDNDKIKKKSVQRSSACVLERYLSATMGSDFIGLLNTVRDVYTRYTKVMRLEFFKPTLFMYTGLLKSLPIHV